MTNSEYERGCNTAALGLAKLAAVDAKITETEQALVYLLHARREIVNQYDLNKKPVCAHKNIVMMPGLYLSPGHPENRSAGDFCTDCGMRIPA